MYSVSGVLDEWGFTLERYALHSVENCPDRTRYAWSLTPDIRLTGAGDHLSRMICYAFDAGTSAVLTNILLSNYSLAVHIIDSRTFRPARGPGRHRRRLRAPSSRCAATVDISALPPGEYELRVALYDWRTGARLLARDLETGASGDFHTLYRFLHN